MNDGTLYKSIGLMSGTSLDGLDVALVETDGVSFVKPLAAMAVSYEERAPKLRARLRDCLGLYEDADGAVAQAERDFTLFTAGVVRDFLSREGLIPSDIDWIGFHGQTIMHDPDKHFTWQIGDGAFLARESGIDVVCDFRSADMEAGGQGAPFLPLYHHMLVEAAKVARPCMVLNLGGVSNLTLVRESPEELIAFDLGPANALMDDLIKTRTGQGYDAGGALAATGQVRDDLVAQWMAHPYFALPYPKSLDRDAWDVAGVADLSLEDGLATLAEFTVQAVKAGADLLPARPEQVIVCGGGRHNHYVMKRLQEALGVGVLSADDFGWDGDFVEAQGFGFYAVRSVLGLPITYPGTTGVSGPTAGGQQFFAVQ